MALGFGAVFQDEAMGSHWMALPDQALLTRFEFLYALLRAAATGEAIRDPSAQAEEAPRVKVRRLPPIRRPGVPR